MISIRTFVLAVATVGIAPFVIPSQAQAWECISNPNYTGGAFGCSPTACRFQPGNSLTYHFINTKFSAAEEGVIDDAAAAWRAGAGQLNRGADWQFSRGADSALGSLDNTDGRTDVSELDDVWFAAQGLPANAIAVAVPVFGAWPFCGISGWDIVFRSTVSWSTALPNATTAGQTSLGQVAIHEFGHVIGFGHEDGDVAVMNSTYPNGGDSSGLARINEMDYVGLRDNYGDSSTGKNLMANKFTRTGVGTSREVWTGATVFASRGAVLSGGNVPDDILVLLTGTSSVNNVKVSWFLRPTGGGTCGDAASILVGSKTLNTVGVGVPFPQNLATWTIPLGAPSGDYFVCALVDPDGVVSETREDDNNVKSERIYHVN